MSSIIGKCNAVGAKSSKKPIKNYKTRSGDTFKIMNVFIDNTMYGPKPAVDCGAFIVFLTDRLRIMTSDDIAELNKVKKLQMKYKV